MKFSKIVLVLIVAAVLIAPLSYGQRQAGATSAAFLKVGVGARQVGMGSAATAISGDVNMMFWNPAGIALKTERLQASFSYNKWLADMDHNSAAVSYNLEGIGTIGAGFVTLGQSGIPAQRDPFTDPLTSTTFDYRDLAVQVSFARYIMDNLSLGASVRYISEKIDDQSAAAIAFDVGSIYHIGLLDWKVGARLSNIGSDIKYYSFSTPVPIMFSMGTAMTPVKDEYNSLTMIADLVKPQDNIPQFNVGLEYSVLDMLFIRGGYKFNYSGSKDDGRITRNPTNTTIEGGSVGGGVKLTFSDYVVSVDYTFTQMDILDNVHRITIQGSWK